MLSSHTTTNRLSQLYDVIHVVLTLGPSYVSPDPTPARDTGIAIVLSAIGRLGRGSLAGYGQSPGTVPLPAVPEADVLQVAHPAGVKGCSSHVIGSDVGSRPCPSVGLCPRKC